MQEKARGMTDEQLEYALKDIKETIKTLGREHPNEGWYLDEASTYGDELRRRRNKLAQSETPRSAQPHSYAAHPRTHMYEYYVEHARKDLEAALASYQSSHGEHLMTWDLLRAIDKIKLAFQVAEQHEKEKKKEKTPRAPGILGVQGNQA
jgi:hypothetical protein